MEGINFETTPVILESVNRENILAITLGYSIASSNAIDFGRDTLDNLIYSLP